MNNSWIKKVFKTNLEKDILKQPNEAESEAGVIITIGRELGSGGRKIAKKVAEKLNLEYYDKEIITTAAKKSGIDEELFKQLDEANLDSFWFEFTKEAYEKEPNKKSFKELTAADKLFMIQSDVIREIAKKGNAVIVGRCSSYILKNESKKVFITANEKDRVERIKRTLKVSEKMAKNIMKKSDNKRKEYHLYYTNQDWQEKSNYDLYINTSVVGVEKAVDMIVNLVK